MNRFFHPSAPALKRLDFLAEGFLPDGLIDLPLQAGETTLGRVAADGNPFQISAAIGASADPKATDLRGIPPTVHAALSRNHLALKTLLANGANSDAPDANGRTALHYAFLFGDIDTIDILLENGCNMLARDVDGRDVIDYARAVYNGKDVKAVAAFAQKLVDAFEKANSKAGTAHNQQRPRPFEDLRGDLDFQRIDSIQLSRILGIIGINIPDLFFIYSLPIGAAFLFKSLAVGLVILHLVLFARLSIRFLTLEKPKRDEAMAIPVPAASVREVQFILRAASRHLMSRLDKELKSPASTRLAEFKLWVIALLAPLGSLVIAGLIAGMLAGGMWVLSSVPNLALFVFALIGLPAILMGPWISAALTDRLFAHFAKPILVKKITDRQNALSSDINARLDLREGGTFADGGILYLRSFESDGKFKSGGLDFELLLLRLFEDRAPLFALNKTPESRGAINIKTDDESWRDVVNDLIERSSLVLMIPAQSEGVIEEITALQDGGWFEKTLFVAPPENDDRTVNAEWETMRNLPQLRHLEIPPYCDTGFLFRLEQNGRLFEAGPLGVDRSPPPLVEYEEAQEGKYEAYTDDGSGDDIGDILEPNDAAAGGQEAWIPGDGGATGAAAPASSVLSSSAFSTQASLASSTAQFATLTLVMQSVPQLSAAQLQALTGYGGNGTDGSDGEGGYDGGGAG